MGRQCDNLIKQYNWPAYIKTETANVSHSNFWSIICANLTDVYGKYADPEYCYNIFLAKTKEKKNSLCSKNDLDNIAEIGWNDIERLLSTEDNFKKRVDEVINLYNEPQYDKIELSKKLGIYPDKSSKGLYDWIITKDNISNTELRLIEENIIDNIGKLDCAAKLLVKNLIGRRMQGYISVGDLITQSPQKYYYRGENAYYGSSKAGIYRATNYKSSNPMDGLIKLMRLYQSWETFDQIDVIRKWYYGDVDYLALSQHYGLATNLIDITSDLKTALFFACCIYENKGGWRPLRNEEIEKSDSRKGIFDRGGDSRYGILYQMPMEASELMWAICKDKDLKLMLIPTGYQPLMRCSSQHGYTMFTHEEYDMYGDTRFMRYKIRLMEELCEKLFVMMDEGRKIYPNSDADEIPTIINKINTSRVFSDEIFYHAFDTLNYPVGEIGNVVEMLKAQNIIIKQDYKIISNNEIQRVNEHYKIETVMANIKKEVYFDPLFCV